MLKAKGQANDNTSHFENKGAEVVAIDAAHQVAEAVRIMDKRQIGALVVTGQGEDCSGILPSAT